MKVLVINGSPKGDRSNSLQLAKAFLRGLSGGLPEGTEVEQIDVCRLDIQPCRGCFGCWKATPGSCVIRDDMAVVIQKMLWADLILLSFPLFYFSVPGSLKNLIDRQLPMALPFMEDRSDGVGSGSHPARYDMSGKRWVLISTCGFYSAEGNYDGVCSLFDHICGKGKYETVFCGQGELFSVKELSARTAEYLRVVERAGSEYAGGGIAEKTRQELSELLFPKETFEAMADASWGVDRETGEKEDESLVFIRQMAALYNKGNYDGKDRVLEICYTDLGKTYQILLGKEGAKVCTDGSLAATTRIDTPWDVWLSISRGEMRGDEALAKHLYRTSGDFSLMMHWDKYFGSTDPSKTARKSTSAEKAKKPPVMITMLAAWITLWVALSIHAQTGALVTLGVCACLPLIMARHELCVCDRISLAAVGLLAVFAVATGAGQAAVNLGYLLFGVLWLGSCLTKEPLCAAYVKYGYGDDALRNPIFLKTNYIIAAAWGVLYLLIALWTFLLSGRIPGLALVLLNQIMPLLLGIFTVWFQSWYPAKVAAG